MRSWSRSVKSPFDHDAEKCCKRSRSQERKRYNRGGSCTMKSPFNYGAKKPWKQLRSRSPVRKRYKRSRSCSVKSPFDHDAEKHCE